MTKTHEKGRVTVEQGNQVKGSQKQSKKQTEQQNCVEQETGLASTNNPAEVKFVSQGARLRKQANTWKL